MLYFLLLHVTSVGAVCVCTCMSSLCPHQLAATGSLHMYINVLCAIVSVYVCVCVCVCMSVGPKVQHCCSMPFVARSTL